jgi:branched-chain amino acid transport system permease protein
MIAVVLDGIVLGLQFGLLAVGMTLVYGLGGVLNLAHGQTAVVSAIAVSLAMGAGVPVVPAVALGLVVGAAFGLALDTTLLRPVYRQSGEPRVLLGLLLTLGVAFLVDGLLVWRMPLGALSINVRGEPVLILGVPMRLGSMVASGLAIAAGALLVAFFRLTATGRAVRSVIQDETGARLIGVDPDGMRRLILALSGGLAALVAVTQSMTAPVTVTDGIELTIFALIVTVVGGLASVSGAFLAGILLGIVNTVSSFYIGTFITTIILLAAAALTIIVRPAGLLGTAE